MLPFIFASFKFKINSFLYLRILLLEICVKSSHVLSYFSKILLLLPVVKEKLVNKTEAVIANVALHDIIFHIVRGIFWQNLNHFCFVFYFIPEPPISLSVS